MEHVFKVGRNSIAVVEPDFSSEEDRITLDVCIALNAAKIEEVEPDREDEVEKLLEEASSIFIEALRNYALEHGAEVSDTDFTLVE